MSLKPSSIFLVFIAAVFLVFNFSACKKTAKQAGDDDVLAVVDGMKITVKDFKAATEYNVPKDIAKRREALEKMIRDMLVSKLALHEGFGEDDDVSVKLMFFYSKYLPGMLRDDIAGKVSVADDEVPESEIKDTPIIELYQITTPGIEDAEKAMAELDAGEDFGEVALKHSKGLGASAGGYVGKIDMDTDLYSPYVKAILNKVEPGKLSPITKTDFGYAIFKVASRMESDVVREMTLENARNRLKEQKTDQEFSKLAKGLRDAADIQYNQKLIEGDLGQTWAAKVNGTVINLNTGMLEGGMGTSHQPHQELSTKTVMRALDKMIDGILLSEEAIKRGLDKDPDFQRMKRFELERIISQVYIEKGLGNFEVTQQEIQDYYDENKEKYRQKEIVRISRILVKDEKDANEALAELNAGKDFAKVAHKWSIDKSNMYGGDMGWHDVGTLISPLADAVAGLKVGETSPVIKSEYGFEIIRLANRNEGGIQELAKVSGQVKSRVKLRKQSDAVQSLMKRVTKDVKTELDEELLESL